MNTDENNQKGFIKLIILLILVFVILIWLGFNPNEIYTKYILPALDVGWEIIKIIFGGIIELAKFCVFLLKGGWESLSKVLEVTK